MMGLKGIVGLFLFFSTLTISSSYTLSSDPAINPDPPSYVAPNLDFDVIHTELNLDIDLKKKFISGSATHTLKPLRSNIDRIHLNCVNLTVDSAYIDGKPVRFSYPLPGHLETSWIEIKEPREATDELVVYSNKALPPGKALKLKIKYKGYPKEGLYFIQPEKGLPGKRYEVWSQGEGEDNRYWIPCFDYPNDKATFEGIFRVAKGYYALSNGVLKSVKNIGNKTEYHWLLDTPQASYLIMLAAGKYKIFRDEWEDMELMYLVPPATGEKIVKRTFELTPDMIGFYSRIIGIRYPFKKYAQVTVQNFIYGGMENTTATVLNTRTLRDERATLTRDSQGLVAHELAHMWWGDMVTCREWTHMWLNEGFATYFGALYNAYHRGDDSFRYQMDRIHTGVIERDKKSARPVVVDFFNRKDKRNSSNVYIKGASFLHMLRFLLGDSLFFATIKNYGEKHKYNVADTHDFAIVVKETSGLNLDWLFEQWLYLAGHPDLVVTKDWDESSGVLHLSVKQVQATDDLVPIFRLPVDVEITSAGSKKIYRILLDKKDQDFYFKLDARPRLVIFDKGDWLLKTLDFKKSKEELIFQLHNGNTIEKIRAIRSLAKRGEDESTVKELAGILLEEGFWGMRKEAAQALGKIRSNEARNLLIKALSTGEARVRLACAEALGTWEKDSQAEKALLELFSNDLAYEVQAQAISSLVKIKSNRGYQTCIDALKKDSHQELIRVAALKGLKKLEDTRAMAKVRPLAKPGNNRLYRHEAISTLAALAKELKSGKEKKKAVDFLSSMLDDWYLRTRATLIAALKNLGERKAIESLHRVAAGDPIERLREQAQKAISSIESSSANKEEKEKTLSEIHLLKARIDSLRKDLKSLRAKIGEEEMQHHDEKK